MTESQESPFEGQNKSLQNVEGAKRQKKLYFIITGIILFILIIAYFLMNDFNKDRYRTLESVQFNEALDNHERLLGGKFKMTATVDAELGTEIGNGKLVAFRDPSSKLVLPVLIPSSVLDNKSLNKGQEYQMEVEVLRGGLLQVNHIEKK
jgi:hypothetical protein